MKVKELKEKYGRLAKKYKLPSFKDLNDAFEIDRIERDPEELLREKVIQMTVKWPRGISSPEFLYNSRAGVVPTLYQTILLHSYFLSPQQAMMLTAQL